MPSNGEASPKKMARSKAFDGHSTVPENKDSRTRTPRPVVCRLQAVGVLPVGYMIVRDRPIIVRVLPQGL